MSTTLQDYAQSVWIDESELMLGKKHVRELLDSAQAYDQLQYRFWRTYLENIAIAGFTWENVPAGIDPRAIEYILLYYGMGALFTESEGVLFAQAAPAENVNMFFNHNKINLF